MYKKKSVKIRCLQIKVEINHRVMNLKFLFVIFNAICGISGHLKLFGNGCGRKFANDNDWPWLVGFVYQPFNHLFCSGHLISARHVLSGEN